MARAIALVLGSAFFTAALAQVPYKIVTASERGTYIQIGRDLAKWVAPEAGINLEVLPSAGSAENVRRLRYEPGVKFALVQSDVYQAFIDQASAGNGEARTLIQPLRLIVPLYNEELYFVARADAPFEYVHQIRDARINLGPIGSGTAMAASTVYGQLFNRAVPEQNASYLSNEDGLVKLTGDRSVDVVVVVAGQPAKLFADMKPEARGLLKLLKFDAKQPSSEAVLQTYFAATIRAASYPNLLAEDVPTLAVKAYLATYDFNRTDTAQQVARFARSLCANMDRLRAEGHPKWREVELSQPTLARGWSYYAPARRELQSCLSQRAQSQLPVTPSCSQEQRILGLCVPAPVRTPGASKAPSAG